MTREFIQVRTRATAVRRAPWAAVIIKVDGGYLAFASVTDAMTWRNQR